MSLFNELKRRNVFKVTFAYVVMAWLVMQVTDVVLNNITAPGWIFHVLLLFLAIGLPFAVFFAWANTNLGYTAMTFDIDLASAARYIERGLQLEVNGGLAGVIVDPFFTRLHDDPRWQPLLEKSGASATQLAAIEFKITLPK